MAVLKPRERLVYFRISEDEFRQFSSVCEQEGARSVSDLARNAVQRLIADGHRQREGDELAQRMNRLEQLIAAVTEQLKILMKIEASDAADVDAPNSNVEGCPTLVDSGSTQSQSERTIGS